MRAGVPKERNFSFFQAHTACLDAGNKNQTIVSSRECSLVKLSYVRKKGCRTSKPAKGLFNLPRIYGDGGSPDCPFERKWCVAIFALPSCRRRRQRLPWFSRTWGVQVGTLAQAGNPAWWEYRASCV